MNEIKMADWTLKEIAEENNKLNETYFLSGSYKNLLTFCKLREAFDYILKNDSKRPLTLVDHGCGSGWAGVYIQREGLKIEYNGTDVSQNMINNTIANCKIGSFTIIDIAKETTSDKYDIAMEGGVVGVIKEWRAACLNILKSSAKWVVFHRLFVCDEPTRYEQTETYLKIPDIRNHINLIEFTELLNDNNFEIVKGDIFEKNRYYTQGTFVARRKKNA